MSVSVCSLPLKQRAYQRTVDLEVAACERSFYAFVRFAWPNVDDSPFVDNWHIRAICEHLQAVYEGKIENLLINVPPGCGKSLLVSVMWPVWVWIKKPSARFMCASYGAELSTRDAVKSRWLIDSSWFQSRWGTRFQFADDQNAKTRYENNRKGWRIATSVGGRVTGEHPDFIVVDDPHNAKDAQSEAKRLEVTEWWDGSISTRGVARGVRKVVIMQRLHEVDLSGILLKKGEFEHLCLPMRFERDRMPTTSIGFDDPRTKDGELMFPQVFPEKAVKTLELNLGIRASGQLQQNPTPADGEVFKKQWFRYYHIEGDLVVPEDGTPPFPVKKLWRLGTMDLACSEETEADYTVLQSWGVGPGNRAFLLDQLRDQIPGPNLVPSMKSAVKRNELDWIGVETAGFQLAIIQQARLAGLTVKKIIAKGDKKERAIAASPRMSAGMVYFPHEAWTKELEKELLFFPFGEHDDQVDTLSYALIEIHRIAGGLEAE
jgi:predicted phage terminase large subunit-like protein